MSIVANPNSEPATRAETSALRVGFVVDAPANAEVLRRYTDPRTTLAVQMDDAPGSQSALEIFESTDKTSKLAISVETADGRVNWEVGRAMVPALSLDILLPAVIDFAFYESELRRLEQAIIPHQGTAEADVRLAYNIRESDRSQWDRLYKTMEELYRLRLQFARLEPRLGSADRTMSAAARRCFNRLLIKAQIEDRLVSLNDRLETVEDLYEGACDRITDYRNYRKGSLLEMGIIILLALEVALLLWHRG